MIQTRPSKCLLYPNVNDGEEGLLDTIMQV
jgi:hypothetical protein